MIETTDSKPRKRIILADALRGFALMGLFIVHMVEYFELYWYKPDPGWVHSLIFFLFGGKAYGIFALLFGLSFYIIIDNYQKRGVDFRGRFCWRLLTLLLFGYLHSLIYAGDILQFLAICGFLLVACQRLSVRWLAFISAIFLIQGPQIIAIVHNVISPVPGGVQPKFFAAMGANFQIYANANLLELVQYNLVQGQLGKWYFFFETGRIWSLIGLMFAGAVLGRVGFFERERFNVKLLAITSLIALGIYFALQTANSTLLALAPEGMARWQLGELLGYYKNLCLIVVGVLVFIVLFNTPKFTVLLRAFAPAGKMTLTFYIVQSIVFVPIFYGFGLGAYAWLGQELSLALGVLAWLLQLWLAHMWLRKYSYGPLEKLWRQLTLLGFRNIRS